jgi:Holliday junction resolvasome RuvABC endonuclease subunit
MKTRDGDNHACTLAIAPSSRGFGFAVIEENGTLVDWGVKSVRGNKNARCRKKAEELIVHYRPELLVLEHHSSRRNKRILALSSLLAEAATRHKTRVQRVHRHRVYEAFGLDGKGTKHALAEILAGRYRLELGPRLPPKRKPWMSEDYRMGIFDALALALGWTNQEKQRKEEKVVATRGG